MYVCIAVYSQSSFKDRTYTFQMLEGIEVAVPPLALLPTLLLLTQQERKMGKEKCRIILISCIIYMVTN